MTIVVPPLSPGYRKYPNSGMIVIAAGPFIGPARSGLNTYSDTTPPGPQQVQDNQTAANGTAALDTVVIDLDTVGGVSGMRYKTMVGYRVINGGSAVAHLAAVDHAGTVYEDDIADGGQILNITTGYGLSEPLDARNGVVLKTGAGQTFKLRSYLVSGSGSILLDCIFLLPLPAYPTLNWGPAWNQYTPGYGNVNDGWFAPGGPPDGFNGQFPTSDGVGPVTDSSGYTSAPPDPSTARVEWDSGIDTTSLQRALVTARVTDKTKGIGSITAVNYTGTWAAGTTYTVPADENVYFIDMDADSWIPSFANDHGFQPWAANAAQSVHMDLIYTGLVDPLPVTTGPSLVGEFRAA